ncbi:MAG: biosynthetic-type acetolactate synthase large subunit [Gammaproteobacteria bacterium]|nr:biosynthetic-type acetolactate synthase large subunit [Gammaproteobacteria bacterium]MDE0715743.1 biosynthetic-type acetolactate synthase large subunit [Gammaproteobacteria bacterium]MXY65746.1 biosynthetic-type acetolactate synthase large subunit [Gammaproteobacteria bacterium]MYG67739.1 biosynthetic-type acetolactate synthase large subunit [Gammaproteobacteria bacterium]MYH91345.1 biosynthetic-type acetolactate synthase large subunit [Gammaproteobacteria bacterium]
MQLTGADIVVRCLQDEGIEYIFGYPGGAALHIYDALYKQDKVKHILVRHEQGATHMADGYARATGKAGVVLVTSGPGVTNTVTGIATAYMDSVPMVVLTAQVPSHLIGDDAFQEVDTVGITRPCVKHNFLVGDVNKLAETMKKAFYIAESGRPGPVVVDIPKDVTAKVAEYHYPEVVDMRSYQPRTRGHIKQISRGLDLLVQAKRPVVYTGGGVVLGDGSAPLRKVVSKLGFPSTSTLMGLGAIPHDDPNFLGMLGMHGTYEANMAMHQCDVMFAIGARFDDRVTGELSKFAPDARIIQIDIDPSSIGKNVPVEVPIVGDCGQVLEQMLEQLDARLGEIDRTVVGEWWAQVDKWRAVKSLDYQPSKDKIVPQLVVERLMQITDGEAFVSSDVGQHQMWAAQYYGFSKPRRWINSGGLGTMGFGLPAAMGIQLAYPDDTVICISGDASIQMCLQELSTCLQYELPVKIINLNNQYMGMVRQWQEFFYDRRYSHSYMDALPDFVKLSESYGHVGIRVEDPADLDEALNRAFSMKDRLVFVDVITDPTVNVYPMIAAGKGHNEMHLQPDQEEHQERELA